MVIRIMRNRTWRGERSSKLWLLLTFATSLVVVVTGIIIMNRSDIETAGGLEFVIPYGASETVEVPTINSVIEIPTKIVFSADETAAITIRNNDSVANRAGPWVIGPGQSYSIRFDNPGEYFFACSVDPLESVSVVVEDP